MTWASSIQYWLVRVVRYRKHILTEKIMVCVKDDTSDPGSTCQKTPNDQEQSGIAHDQ